MKRPFASGKRFQREIRHVQQRSKLGWQPMINEMNRRLNLIDYGADREHIQIDYTGFLEPVHVTPMSPNRLHVITLSLMLGGALAIAIPFLIAYLDNKRFRRRTRGRIVAHSRPRRGAQR